MARFKLTGKRLLLLLLYSPGVTGDPCEPIEGRTRLTKMVFLFEEEVAEDFRRDKAVELEDYGFEAWKYGPMSRKLFEDLEFLQSIGFVETGPASDTSGLSEEAGEYRAFEIEGEIANGADVESYQPDSFRLSETGKAFVKERLYPELSPAQRDLLRSFKASLNGRPLRSILRYVYQRYPEMAEESEIREKVLGTSNNG